MLSVNHAGASSSSLVADVRRLGIEIPEEINAETQRYRLALKVQDRAQEEYDAALFSFQAAQEDDTLDAERALVDAAARLRLIRDGLDMTIINVAGTRLDHRVYDAILTWEPEVVRGFNEIVEHYELNRVAPNLPDFGDPGTFSVLSLSTQQGDAVERWRAAADALRPLWTVYVKLATIRGYEIGPLSVDHMSSNLFTACVLGDPGSYRGAAAAAERFASVAGGSTAARAYAPIMPFVAPALGGYDLRLSTIRGAEAIRRRIQPAA